MTGRTRFGEPRYRIPLLPAQSRVRGAGETPPPRSVRRGGTRIVWASGPSRPNDWPGPALDRGARLVGRAVHSKGSSVAG